MTNLRPLVSVIIPAYGKSEQLPEVARSVARSSYRPLEVILVDNRVDRRALEASVRELEGVDVRVVGTGENLGTAAGRNAGARQARGELLLFLDSDVTLDEEAIEAMVDFLGSHPGYGIIGPLIFYAGGGFTGAAGRWSSHPVGCGWRRTSQWSRRARQTSSHPAYSSEGEPSRQWAASSSPTFPATRTPSSASGPSGGGSAWLASVAPGHIITYRRRVGRWR